MSDARTPSKFASIPFDTGCAVTNPSISLPWSAENRHRKTNGKGLSRSYTWDTVYTCIPMAPARKRDRIARVTTTNEVWAEFRAIDDNRSIGERLGHLVEREVRRSKRAEIRRGSITEREAVDAITEAREIQQDLESIVSRLERREAKDSIEPPPWEV